MSILRMDSRSTMGTDIRPVSYPRIPEAEAYYLKLSSYPCIKTIRVILGSIGSMKRLSAPELDLFVDGVSYDETWTQFIQLVAARSDASFFSFDVSHLRVEEMLEALDAPEDEDWTGLVNDYEDK